MARRKEYTYALIIMTLGVIGLVLISQARKKREAAAASKAASLLPMIRLGV